MKVSARPICAGIVPVHSRTLPLLLVVVVLLLGGQSWAEGAMPLNSSERDKLARLIQTDADAAKQFKKIQRRAEAALDDTPNPVRTIATAGKLASHPAKLESRMGLEDMKKVEALGFAYTVTANVVYANAAKNSILSWSQTYEPSGSPIDETKLEPLFVAYGLVGSTFSAEERKSVDAWLRLIVEREWSGVRPNSVTASNNWNSHRLKVVGLIGFLLEDRALIDQSTSGFKKQIADNLLPDGSSLDFHERDALHYHCYDLEPLLTLAIAARQHDLDYYEYESPAGASLRKSVHFLIPYCDGTATHAEWVNSKVAFDHKRAAAGEAGFEIGGKFNPQHAFRVLILASYFDRRLDPVVTALAKQGGESTRFPVWQSVINEALRP